MKIFNSIKKTIDQIITSWTELQETMDTPPKIITQEQKSNYSDFINRRLDDLVIATAFKHNRTPLEIKRFAFEFIFADWLAKTIELERQKGSEPDLDKLFVGGIEEILESKKRRQEHDD